MNECIYIFRVIVMFLFVIVYISLFSFLFL